MRYPGADSDAGDQHSLNVATAGGVVIYELLRKYRALGVR